MLIKTGLLTATTAALLTLAACNSADVTKMFSPAKGSIAATVNGTAINQSRVELMVKQQASQGQADSAELRKGIIEHLAMQFLLSQEAIKKGLDRNAEVLDQIELTQQSILANAFVQDYFKNGPVTDDQLKAEYEKIKDQTSGNEYKARHILVEKEAVAKDIIAKLKKDSRKFESLAKENSMDPGSKDKGGDLGWFDPRGMVPEFGAAVALLSKGKFTEQPVKSQFGYHVILLEDSRPKQAPSFDQIKPMLRQQVQQQNLKKLLEDTKTNAKIEIVQAAGSDVAAPKQGKPAEPGKQ